MILVDTGYSIALVNVDDQQHDVALRWTSHLTSPLLVTQFVLMEAINALSKPALRHRALDVIDAINEQEQFRLLSSTTALVDQALQLFRDRMDKEWSLTDCVSFTVMSQMKITQALAHDHHFEQAGFEALLRRNP